MNERIKELEAQCWEAMHEAKTEVLRRRKRLTTVYLEAIE
jgi:hypothetical protein